jgi:serine phosphatase RsbU (regulator of sigma subunit)/putative methionine-R-sulfoxide reductase with GAF domain
VTLPSQTTGHIKFGIHPNVLLKLGEELVNTPSCNGQKNLMINFLQKNFGGKAFVWLNNPPKSYLSHHSVEKPPDDWQTILPANMEINAPLHADDGEGTHFLALPLMKVDRQIGVIGLKRDKDFTDQERLDLRDISRVAGLGFYAAMQTNLQAWRQKQLALVRSVTAQISQFTHLDDLVNKITSLVQETFDYYYVAIFLLRKGTDRLFFKASSGRTRDLQPDFELASDEGFKLGEYIIGYVAQEGVEVVANDVSLEPRYKAIDSLPETQSEVVLPLKIEGRIFGVFDIQSKSSHAFSEDDLMVLRALADNIAIAIETTRLIEDINHRAEQLSIVAETSRAITYILDLEELLARIVNLIHERFDIPFVHLYTLDPIQEKIMFRAGSGERAARFQQAQVTYYLSSQKGIIPWVARNAQTMRIEDVKENQLYQDNLLNKNNTGSELAIPLIFGGEVLGVLDIQSDKRYAFTQDDQQLMETLADNVAIAIRNAKLYRSEKWRRQVAESLRDVAGLLSDNTALQDVLDAILTELHKNLPCDIAGIWLWDSETTDDSMRGQELRLAAYQTAGDFPSEHLGNLRLKPDAWVQKALDQEEPTIRRMEDPIGPIGSLFQLDETYSAIAAPLHTGDEILGMLTLIHHTPGRYGLESQKITSAFASYAAIAIENTRLYETSQEQAWISTILLQVAQATQSQTTISELVETIVRLTPLVVGVKGCALFLKDPDSDVFSLHAMYGVDKGAEEINLQQPMPLPNAPIFDELILTQVPLFIRDPAEDLNLPGEFSEMMQDNVLVLLPLIARSEMLGAFLLVNDSEVSTSESQSLLSDERLGIIQGITQQTAIAVENIRLLEAKQEEAYVSNVLLQVAQAVVNSAELDDTLDSIVHIMPILVGIDSSLIYRWDKSEDVFKVTQAYTKTTTDEDQLIGNTYNPDDFPMLETVFKNNRPIVYPFVETTLPPEDWDLVLPDEGQVDPTPVLQSRYPLLLGFPLSVKEENYGVLLAQDKNYSSNRERRFELLWGIAQQASLAIQNDLLNKEMMDRQRLEREFQLAREIQQTFLPDRMPDMPGWEMDVRWHTARQVGGDFYDYFILPDGRLAFVIADVSNKGLAASLYMTVTRTLIRAAASESSSPARTLERVNDLLLMNSEVGLFVTTFYGILDLSSGQLIYTNAGHNPPVLIDHHQEKARELKKGGIALGALDDIHLTQNQVMIQPGDCLVLYTDGVTEAFDEHDQMYGDERLMQVLSRTTGKDAHTVLEILEEDLAAFRDEAPLSDDTTLLAICRK